MRVSDVKREYQLQEWSGMLRECKESGLTVKNWCAECDIPDMRTITVCGSFARLPVTHCSRLSRSCA